MIRMPMLITYAAGPAQGKVGGRNLWMEHGDFGTCASLPGQMPTKTLPRRMMMFTFFFSGPLHFSVSSFGGKIPFQLGCHMGGLCIWRRVLAGWRSPHGSFKSWLVNQSA